MISMLAVLPIPTMRIPMHATPYFREMIRRCRSSAFLMLAAGLPVLGAVPVLGAPPAATEGAAPVPEGAGLSLLVLGSGGPGATGRAGAGYLVCLDGQPRVLVDAGPGTFVRAGEAVADLSQVDVVLLTHLHVDHAGELSGLIKARLVSERRDLEFKIFGPPGSPGGHGKARFPSTTQFVELMFGARGAFSYLSDFAGHLTLHPRDVRGGAEGRVLLKEGGLVISASTGHHGDAP